MKKVIYLFVGLIALLFVTSCDNEEPTVVEPTAELVEVSFDLTSLTSNDVAAKDSDKISAYPECSDNDAATVELTIDGTPYVLEMTALGTNETEVLKLPSGDHIISAFAVKDASGEAIYVAPNAGSDAATIYGLKGLPFTMNVPVFNKHRENVDVLCYNPASYALFGYAWFQYKVYEENEIFLYGDVCTKFFADWHTASTSVANPNPYVGQTSTGYDFPAIFKAEIEKDGTVVATDDNIDSKGEGEAGLVRLDFINDPVLDEDFELVISLIMPDGTDEEVYREDLPDGSLSVMDDANGFGGVDGVFDFVVGNCDTAGNNDADLTLPAWIPLATKATMTLSDYGDAGIDGYITATFSNVIDGHPATIDNGTVLPMWCADKDRTINANGTYHDVKFHSSLQDLTLVTTLESRFHNIKWGALNWLMNNKAGYTDAQIQAAIWHITDGEPVNALATLALAKETYKPKVGDYAIVLCDSPLNVQLMIVRVDP